MRHVLFGLCLLFGILTIRPASAQTAGNCVNSAAISYASGLTSVTTNQAITIDAELTGCAFLPKVLTNPAPAIFRWTGTAYNVACTNAQGDSVSEGNGTITWNDDSTSTVIMTSLTNVGLSGITPAQANFKVVSGPGAGGTFTVVDAFVPAPNQLTCSNSNPIHILTGTGTDAFLNLSSL
jgi:hypothetical protein